MQLLSHHLRFLACEASLEEARFVLYGAPFDGTCSYRPGTRFAPQAMREASDGMESYSPLCDRDLADLQIYDGGDLEPSIGNVAAMLELVEEQTRRIYEMGKVPLMLGGEHSLSLGAVRAAFRQYPELCLLHLDAHTDLREDYLGLELSHASVIRRCWELLGDRRIYSLGIRSGLAEEFAFAREHLHFYPHNLAEMSRVAAELRARDCPVYLTLDLDVLDPAYFPGTGTPEPGGVSYQELIQALGALSGINCVGLDLMELSPHYDMSGVSTMLAAKLLRELVLGIFSA